MLYVCTKLPQCSPLCGFMCSAEHRIAVESRIAAPDDGAPRVDQEAQPAVADQREVEIARQRFSEATGDATSAVSHSRTAATSGSR